MLPLRLTAVWAVAPKAKERGDVPGWVLITGMTVALVMLIWGVASNALRDLITGFLSNISFGG
jgi:hypothetical protein